MRDSSKKFYIGQFDPIKLDPDFPITKPMFTSPPGLPHVHDCFEIGFCYEGGGVFMIENKIFPCSPGQTVFINKREFHLLRNATPNNSRWKFINLDPSKLLLNHIIPDKNLLDLQIFSGPEFKNVIGTADDPIIPELVKDLIHEFEMEKPDYKENVIALIWLIFVKLHRYAPDSVNDSSQFHSKEKIGKSLQYIASKYKEHISIVELAELCNCSVSNYRRIFTQAMNCSPQQYIIRFRLNIATVLLKNSDEQILTIAEETGFPTLSNFNRHFKETFKVSPRQFRNS
jgi:AraC-like DNA-binding protein